MAWKRGNGDTKFIQQVIKTVNFMNRLILEQGKDYMLGMRRTEAEIAEKGSNTDWYPELQEHEKVDLMVAEKSSFAKEKPSCGAVEELLAALKSHAVDILTRENQSKKAY